MSIRGTFYTTAKLGPKQSLTPEGFLLCEEVPLARTGMMIYGPDETPLDPGPDGIVKIMREAEDVFDPRTIASAQGKPVTVDHPDEDVVPDSWKDLANGVMMNVRRGEGAMDDLMLGDLLVTTKDGIEAVRSGEKTEVSLGYEADYIEVSPGVGRQSNIIINHIALVEQGRCGPRCAIRDSKAHSPTKGNSMSTKKHGKILDTLMRAFKAKDADEVEQLAEKIQDEGILPESEDGNIHVHIHNGAKDDEPVAPVTTDEEPDAGRAAFTDQDIQEHMDKNAIEHSEIFSRLEELEKLVAKLGGTADEEVEDDGVPAEVMADEFPEEIRENAVKAKDSAYLADSFKDTVALAEILVPGIRIPTFDRAVSPGKSFKQICGFRRQAIDLAYAQPATRGLLDDLLAGKALDTKNMTCDAVRTLFRSAAAMKRTQNNSMKRVADTGAAVASGPVTLAEINRRNAERYKQS